MATKSSFNQLITSLPFQRHDYQFLSVIGVGGSSAVFKVTSSHYSDRFFAAKVTLKSMKLSKVDIEALKYLVHPHIILIYDFFEDDQFNYLILEYCSNGSLSTLIKDGQIKTHNDKIFYMKKIMEAICFCHSKGIAHRDIKPQNILLDDYKRPKLIDFGICEMLYFNPESIYNNDLNDDYYKAGKNGKIKLITKYFGSCPYLSPEIILNEPYDPFAADIWSLGVTFYEIATGYLPWIYKSENEMKDFICQGLISFPNSIPNSIQYLIKSMLQVDPCQRPTMKSIARFPLFKSDISSNFVFFYNRPIISVHNNRESFEKWKNGKQQKEKKKFNSFEKESYINSNSYIDNGKIIQFDGTIPLSLHYAFRSKTPQKMKRYGVNNHVFNNISFITAPFSNPKNKKSIKNRIDYN